MRKNLNSRGLMICYLNLPFQPTSDLVDVNRYYEVLNQPGILTRHLLLRFT